MINKILAQGFPGNALTALYTAPAGRNVTGSLNICNRSNTSRTVRVSIALLGAADDSKQYLLYDFSLGANSYISVGSIYLTPSDVLRVSSSTSDVSFTLAGSIS